MLSSPLQDSFVVASSSRRTRALSPASAARLATQAHSGPAKVGMLSSSAPTAMTDDAPLCDVGCMTVSGAVARCPYPSTSSASPADATVDYDNLSVAELLARLRGKVIEVEGNIGSGKSTLTRNLSEACVAAAPESPLPEGADAEGPASIVHSEKVNAGFLKAFYESSKEYAFAFQMYMLTTRIFQMDEAYRQSGKEGRLVFLDRGAVGDVLFALQNYKIGNMNDRDMAVYKSVCTERLPESLAERVNAVVYLDVAPAVCWHRMTTVRQREAEEGVPLSYLDGIDSVYFHLLIDWLAGRKGGFHDMNIGAAPPVMVVRWDDFGCTKTVLSQLCALIEGRRASPEVAFTEATPTAADASGFDIVMDAPEHVEALAAELAATGKITNAAGAIARTIAVNWGLDRDTNFRKVVMYILSEQGKVLCYGPSTAIQTPPYNCAERA